MTGNIAIEKTDPDEMVIAMWCNGCDRIIMTCTTEPYAIREAGPEIVDLLAAGKIFDYTSKKDVKRYFGNCNCKQ